MFTSYQHRDLDPYKHYLLLFELHLKYQSDTENTYSVHIFPDPRSRLATPRPLSAETINVLLSNIVMPNNDHQRARRCIAKTKKGSQCNNSIDCPHHRCEEPDCEEEVLHTRQGIPLTPLNLRQEHCLPRKNIYPAKRQAVWPE